MRGLATSSCSRANPDGGLGVHQRLKGFLFVVGLSVISAVSLRLLFDRVSQTLAPSTTPMAVTVSASEVERRFVGCGRFNFVFDERGYSSRQWPEELVSEGPLFRADAFFVARDGDILPVLDDSLAGPIGRYRLVDATVEIDFGVMAATLLPQGDSLAGPLTEGSDPAVDQSAAQPTGRLFLQTPDPRPAGCDRAL